jgi:hypothetical protein
MSTGRGWSQEHIKLGIACNAVARQLMDLANAEPVQNAHPSVARALLRLAGELRAGFRPHRERYAARVDRQIETEVHSS